MGTFDHFSKNISDKTRGKMSANKLFRTFFQNVKQTRNMSVRANKRFYKNVDVVSSGNQYEITLDSHKLKTPNGSVFCVNSELLALGVAHEWSSQKELIMLSQMHLNALSNVCIDNPTQITKYDLSTAS